MRLRLGLLILTSLLFGACSRDLSRTFSSAPSAAVYVIVDISASTDSERVRQQTRKDFETVLSAWAAEGGVLRGDAVGADVLNESTVPIRTSIPAFNMLTSEEEYHKKKVVEPALVEARAQFEQVLARKPAASTEIMSALSLASKVMNGEECRAAKHKVLVLFSDMVEESRLYNFRRDGLSDQRIDQIIFAEKKAGRLPALAGIRIWKAGSASKPMNELKARQLEKFWEKYFAAAGAELSSEHYAPSLLDFNLHS